MPDFPIDYHNVSAPGGSRLQLFYRNWQVFCKNKFVLNVIKHGYRIKFTQPPPLTCKPKPFQLQLPADQQTILDSELQAFLDNNVIEPADISTPGYYSPVFLREKPRHDPSEPIKYRVIIDLSNLNLFVEKIHFKMESTNTIRSTLQVGDYFFTTDLTMAYNTIPMADSSKKYLRFWWNGKPFQFRSLCFGLSSAPWIFTLVMSEMAKYFHMCSIICLFYLDDCLFKDSILYRLTVNQPHLLDFIQSCGWLINFEKSHLAITQRDVYVGTDYNLVDGLVYPPADRWRKLQLKIAAFLSLHQASGKQWSSLMGIITSCQDLTPLGRLMARNLQLHLNKHWKNRKLTHTLIPVTQANKQHLQWWTDPANVMCGTPLRPPPPTIEMWTDASCLGAGGSIQVRGHPETLEHSVTWDPETSQNHINYLELLAVQHCLIHWEELITNQSLLLHVDNTTVLHHINKASGPRSPQLHQLCQDILVWCNLRGVTVKAAHIKGKLNVISDYMSRRGSIIPTEWSIHPLIVEKIKCTWADQPQIDLFATKWNKKLPLYISPVPDPQALHTDALSVDWNNYIAYAYPPPAIMSQVLNKIEQSQCLIYLVAPNWPRMVWFPRLLNLLVDFPRVIPCIPKLLQQPKTQIFHHNPASLSLHVFPLSKNVWRQEDFLHRLQLQSVPKIGTHQNNVMRDIGQDTFIGVKHTYMIHSMPL